MISKANITKYSAVLIIFAAGVFFTLSGHAPSKVRRLLILLTLLLLLLINLILRRCR